MSMNTDVKRRSRPPTAESQTLTWEQRLDGVERLVAEQQVLLDRLHTLHVDAQEEIVVLGETLQSAGLVTKDQLKNQRQARSRSAMLCTVMQSHAMVSSIGSLLGVTALRRLSEASLTHGGGEVRAMIPVISRLHVPEVVLCGGGDGPCMATVERLCIEAGGASQASEEFSPMPTARSGCAGAAADGKVYVFGGYDGRQPVNSAECLDATTGEWEKLPPMRRVHFGCAAVAQAGKLYVFGGYDGRYALSASERYDPSEYRWEELPSMPTARARCAAASSGGHVYVCGGHSGGTGLATAEAFDPIQESWRQLENMMVARQGCAAVSARGKVYVVGGNSDGWQLLAAVECYDPSSGLWNTAHPMPTARTRCAAVAVAGKLYVLGGYRGGHMLATVERLDLEAQVWETQAPLPAPRCDCAAAVIPR